MQCVGFRWSLENSAVACVPLRSPSPSSFEGPLKVRVQGTHGAPRSPFRLGTFLRNPKPSIRTVSAIDTVSSNQTVQIMSEETSSTSDPTRDEKGSVVVELPASPHLFPYPKGKIQSDFLNFDNVDDLSVALANEIVNASKNAIKQKGSFTIVLSGGSLVKALTGLSQSNLINSVEWSKWHVFWADERVVPLTHADSNYKFAKDVFLSLVPIPYSQIYTINDSLSVEDAAVDYENRIRQLTTKGIIATTVGNVFPRFDLVLLGIGPDGHVASLFPNHILLSEKSRWVLPISNSPKPPPQRITLSLPAINSAVHVAFVVFGSSKAEVLQRILERPALPGALPAQMVRPYAGKVSWFTDAQAASHLSTQTWSSPSAYPSLDFKS